MSLLRQFLLKRGIVIDLGSSFCRLSKVTTLRWLEVLIFELLCCQ